MTDTELYQAVKQVQAALEHRTLANPEANAAFLEADIALSDALEAIECGTCRQAPVAYRDIRGVRCEQCEADLVEQERVTA